MILYFFYLHKKFHVRRSVSTRERTCKVVVVNISFNTQAHSAGEFEFYIFEKCTGENINKELEEVPYRY